MNKRWKRWTGSAAMRDPGKVYPISRFTKGGLLVARPPKAAANKQKPWMIYHEPSRVYFPFGDPQRFAKLKTAKDWIENLLKLRPELDWTQATAGQIVDEKFGFRQAFLGTRDQPHRPR